MISRRRRQRLLRRRLRGRPQIEVVAATPMPPRNAQRRLLWHVAVRAVEKRRALKPRVHSIQRGRRKRGVSDGASSARAEHGTPSLNAGYVEASAALVIF